MKCTRGMFAILLFFSCSIFAAEGPSKLKVQFEVTLQQPHKQMQINSNAILVPGADWQTMTKDRSVVMQGKLIPLNAESGRFEFQILDAETQKVMSSSSLVGMYGEESSIRNFHKDKNDQPIADFVLKIKPIIVVE